MEEQDVLTARECAELLGFSEEHVRVLARTQRVPAAKIGGRWRFSRRQVLEWLEARAVPEALVEEELAAEAERRLASSEGRRPFEDAVADVGD
ncbi:MAG: helix-turn-helix domain-containing protein [Armatimonadota bacterium]|nr:helix-turn-helix domain-containing protein [Armatimonadota bacterium]